MSDLIYREDAKDFVRYARAKDLDPIEYLDEVPAADVGEARHGVPNPIEEIYEDTDGAHVYRHLVGYECPFCGSDRIAKYCADCGAKMDGGADGERKGGDE